MHDLIDETFRQMTFFVEVFIIFSLHLSVCSWRDDRSSSLLGNTCEKIFGIVGGVCNHIIRVKICNEFFGLGNDTSPYHSGYEYL